MKYIKQLDGLRAIAVILVIFGHSALHASNGFIHRFPKGTLGVNIFFVLSGFLITWILLESKEEIISKNGNKLSLIKNFVLRRSLRIFPIYYITISAIFIWDRFNWMGLGDHAINYYTYTSNILYFVTNEWDGPLSHLWTLAVEEQFYLVWPWVVLFVNRKTLLWLIPVFIAIGTFSGYFLPDAAFASVLTTSCLDAFGLGALLSWVVVYQPDWGDKFIKYSGMASAIAFGVMLIYLLGINENVFSYVNRRTLHSIISVWVIAVIVLGTLPKPVNAILSNNVLVFIGKISYGIYLFHNLLPFVIERVFGGDAFDFAPELWRNEVEFLIEVSVLILIAWLSWTFIESPINKLKRYFKYTE